MMLFNIISIYWDVALFCKEDLNFLVTKLVFLIYSFTPCLFPKRKVFLFLLISTYIGYRLVRGEGGGEDPGYLKPYIVTSRIFGVDKKNYTITQ